MTVERAQTTLLMALSVPSYARVEFYKKEREKYGLSKETYILMLWDAYKYWWNVIEMEDHRWTKDNNSISGTKLPLLTSTKTGLVGHFGHTELLTEILPYMEIMLSELDTNSPFSIEVAEGYFIPPSSKEFKIYEWGMPFASIEINGRQVPFLNSNIALIFNSSIPLKDGTRFDGNKLKSYYIKGYMSGLEHFEKFYMTPNMPLRDALNNLLNVFYTGTLFEVDDFGFPPAYWPNITIVTFDQDDIYKLGWQAALYLSVLKLKEIYPKEFENFEKLNRLNNKESKL